MDPLSRDKRRLYGISNFEIVMFSLNAIAHCLGDFTVENKNTSIFYRFINFKSMGNFVCDSLVLPPPVSADAHEHISFSKSSQVAFCVFLYKIFVSSGINVQMIFVC